MNKNQGLEKIREDFRVFYDVKRRKGGVSEKIVKSRRRVHSECILAILFYLGLIVWGYLNSEVYPLLEGDVRFMASVGAFFIGSAFLMVIFAVIDGINVEKIAKYENLRIGEDFAFINGDSLPDKENDAVWEESGLSAGLRIKECNGCFRGTYDGKNICVFARTLISKFLPFRCFKMIFVLIDLDCELNARTICRFNEHVDGRLFVFLLVLSFVHFIFFVAFVAYLLYWGRCFRRTRAGKPKYKIYRSPDESSAYILAKSMRIDDIDGIITSAFFKCIQEINKRFGGEGYGFKFSFWSNKLLLAVPTNSALISYTGQKEISAKGMDAVFDLAEVLAGKAETEELSQIDRDIMLAKLYDFGKQCKKEFWGDFENKRK